MKADQAMNYASENTESTLAVCLAQFHEHHAGLIILHGVFVCAFPESAELGAAVQ